MTVRATRMRTESTAFELRIDATAYWVEENPATTSCKHHKGDCEECGTTNLRDALHSTQGGRGVVGRLRRAAGSR